MRVIDTITVNTSMDRAWSVTVDVEGWPRWTPTMERVEIRGRGKLGSGSVVDITQPGLPKAEWRVVALVERKMLSWASQIRGMTFVATHDLSGDDGEVENSLTLEVRGWLAILLRPILRRRLADALRAENEGFKRFCEAPQG